MNINLKKYIVLVLTLMMTLGTFNSCMEDNDAPITEPTRYTNNDVKSYGDLFKVFWNVMQQRYNYFYEQKRADGMDWNKIYKEYYPKFMELKTFGRPGENDAQIYADKIKAAEYFTEIINPIIDRHFVVAVKLPASNNGVVTTYKFSGGMKNIPNNRYNFDSKYKYMKERLAGNAITGSYTLPDGSNFTYLGGYLKTNPDIYYFTHNQFAMYTTVNLILEDKYLSPDVGNSYLLTPEIINSSAELNAIKDAAFRAKVRDFTVNVLNQWNSFSTSAELKTFQEYVGAFKKTEIVSDGFVEASQKALNKSKSLVAYSSASTYQSVLNNESLPYINWFVSKMNNHVKLGYRLLQFQEAAQGVIDKAPFYKQFLNPLRKGDIKKIIIDLRSNGGGLVIDARFFSDRFITKNAIWGYQRTKEGNGLYNYTPWIPMQAKPHRFGMAADIPIAVLTDKGSYSMSEMTTMMLKTQGAQVKSIGDYSAGATAGLGDPDEFNGGITDPVAGRFSFYMPLMATKDANGEVIEGVGVKPDIYVSPPTDAEVANMKNSPSTFVDRVMVEAVKYLSSK